MDWWQWLFVVIAALLFVAVLFWGVQLRRRRGGIVAQRPGSRR